MSVNNRILFKEREGKVTQTNAEIFRKAADYIREHGWQQERVARQGGPRCVLGAIMSSTGADSAWDRERYGTLPLDTLAAAAIVARRVGLDLPDGEGWQVWHWNDAHGRTKEEVLAVLDGLAFDEDLKAAAQSPLPAETKATAMQAATENKAPAYAEVHS